VKYLIMFRHANYLTRDEAMSHFDQTMARTVVRCCGEEYNGYHCTLFGGHSGDHEAWGVGRVKLEYSWPNLNPITKH
jgi:hypothetical protein